ncbi:hypothetical protein H4R99_008784, partial [Coemansia sp. RSA 1722]
MRFLEIGNMGTQYNVIQVRRLIVWIALLWHRGQIISSGPSDRTWSQVPQKI